MLLQGTLLCSSYIYIYAFARNSGSQRIGLFIFCISAINALYFVHRAPYGGEDSTLYVIYIYIYLFLRFKDCPSKPAEASTATTEERSTDEASSLSFPQVHELSVC